MKSKTIFLLDGLGAILSTLGIGALICFKDLIGMPVNYLYLFIIIGSAFSVYSIACYFLEPLNHRKYLRIIAVSNSFYCLLTIYSVYQNTNQLTIIGKLYFILEVIIILALVVYEFKIIKEK